MGASKDAVARFKRSHPDDHAVYEQAGYYEQAFGVEHDDGETRDVRPHSHAFVEPTPDSKVVGVYDSARGELHVEHLDVGASRLREFKLSAEDGWCVTVVCEKTCRAYLAQLGAKKTRRKDRRHVPRTIDVGHFRG